MEGGTTPQHELMFAYSIPLELSEWRNDSIWQSWEDENISNQSEWSSTYQSLEGRIPVFKLIAQTVFL